jgi:hypothetical protein
MSFAFEITPREVFEVLEAHEVAQFPDDEIVEDGYASVCEQEDRITEAVLKYRDPVSRQFAALQEIEAILIEDGLLETTLMDLDR